MSDFNIVQIIAVAALPVLFAITLHEVAHGWMALKLGDRTAMMLGRLTLNPIKHVDPLGTVVLPILMLVMSGGSFMFGWAKPVPVTSRNLRNPRRDMALVSVAGPLSNLIMAFIWAVVMRIAAGFISDETLWFAYPLLLMGQYGVTFNLLLMVLNLLPIPPLDGSRVVSALLPGPLSYQYDRLEVYGLVILLVLLVTDILGRIIAPPMMFFSGLISSIVGI